MRSYSYIRESEQLSIQVLSFGYKYGLPLEADLVMDVRFLPNPYFVDGLRSFERLLHRGGVLGPAVAQAVLEFLSDYCGLLLKLLPAYIQEGKRYLTLAVGCTGGSVPVVIAGADC